MSKILCPICGTATSPSPVVIEDERAYLADESSEKRAIYGKARVFAITDDKSPHYVSHGVFKCQACGERFVAKKHNWQDQEWIPVYPFPRRSIAEDIPEPIKSEFEEANLCFAVGAYRASAAMCQRALESLCQNKKVPGLNELLANGIISQNLFDRATEIRLWAGITKHKPLTESVSPEDAEQLLEYLSMILDHVYVEPARLEALKKKRKQIEKSQ